MTDPSASAVPPPPQRTLLQRAPDILIWGGLAVLLVIAFGPAELNKLPLLFSNSANMHELGRGFMRPDPTNWVFYVAKMWETIQMAIWGTTLAIVTAVPLSLLASRNITINCIAPGFIATNMTEALTDDQKAKINGSIPLGRMGTADDIAAGALYLASDEAGYVTGQTLHINGGMFMA